MRILLVVGVFLAGCSGAVSYVPPYVDHIVMPGAGAAEGGDAGAPYDELTVLSSRHVDAGRLPPAPRDEAAPLPVSAVPVCVKPLLVSLGDSITFGYGLPDPKEAYPYDAAATLGVDVIDQGASGYRIDQITALWQNTGHTALQPGRSNIVTCMAGINDVIQGATAATIEARIAAYAVAVRATLSTSSPPNRLIWGTMTASSVAPDAVRTEVNTYLRAHWQEMGFDGLFDPGGDTHLGVLPMDQKYFLDLAHPNPAGQAILGGLLVPVVEKVCQN